MALSYKYNIDKKDTHDKNNEIILNCIQAFQNTNNLKNDEFVIGGSSCANFMDYFMLRKVHDVDIFLLEKKTIDVVKTERIDTIRICFCANGWETRTVEKQGYKFLSAEDLLIQEAAGALIKLKINNIEYVGRLLEYLNMSPKELIPIMIKSAEESESLTDEWKKTIIERAPFLTSWHRSK